MEHVKLNYLLFVFLQSLMLVYCYHNVKNRSLGRTAATTSYQPLYLTPLIENNRIQEAQAASEVHFGDFKNVKSYSGYFTVDKRYNSNTFFWFFPSETDPANDPVILWLEGGPGATTLIAVFIQNGPFEFKAKRGLKRREFPWTKSHSVLFVDNPVGTGYSFTSDGGYAQNETIIGEHLYEAVTQFFKLFPDFQKNEFFIVGESYAGKFGPAVAHTIHKRNPTASPKINLKGIALGNGYCDPERQLTFSNYMFQLGLIDTNTLAEMSSVEQQVIQLIRQKDYVKGYELITNLFDGGEYGSVVKNATGFNAFYNILFTRDRLEGEFSLMLDYVQRTDVRAAIHVGNNTFSPGNVQVGENLIADFMITASPWVEELLNNYKMLFYNGQLDATVSYPVTVDFLQSLNFNAANQYKTAKRKLWYVEKDLAGYVKTAGNLMEVVVRNAGHLVTYDQPKWAYDLIWRFTRNRALSNNSN